MPFMRKSNRAVRRGARLMRKKLASVPAHDHRFCKYCSSSLLENKQEVHDEALIPSPHFQLTTKAFGACSHSVSKHTKTTSICLF